MLNQLYNVKAHTVENKQFYVLNTNLFLFLNFYLNKRQKSFLIKPKPKYLAFNIEHTNITMIIKLHRFSLDVNKAYEMYILYCSVLLIFHEAISLKMIQCSANKSV